MGGPARIRPKLTAFFSFVGVVGGVGLTMAEEEF